MVNESDWFNIRDGDNWIQLANLNFKEFTSKSYGSKKYARDIIYMGTRMVVSLSKTANEQLQDIILTLQKANVNPLEFMYNIRRNRVGSEAKDVEYKVITGDRVPIQPFGGVITNVQPHVASAQPLYAATERKAVPSSTKPTAFSVPIERQNYVELTKQEAEMIDEAIYFPEKLTEEKFLAGFIHSMMKNYGVRVSRERALEIYKQHYVGPLR